MHLTLKTILNRIENYTSFVYESERLIEMDGVYELQCDIRARKNSRGKCSRCGRRCPGYDTLPERRFEYVGLWGIRVFFFYSPRRVRCRHCDAVVVEDIPWADGKRALTRTYSVFLARWAKRLSWKEVAEGAHSQIPGHIWSPAAE